MSPISLADKRATVTTYTIDRLAYSLSPPTVAAVLDFDGGGRYTCELTDCDPDRGGRGPACRAHVPPHGHGESTSTTTSGKHARSGEATSHGFTRHQRPRAIIGMGARRSASTDKSNRRLLIDSTSEAFASVGSHQDDVDAYWLGTMGSGSGFGAHPLASAEARLQAGHPSRELLRDGIGSVPQRVLRGRVGRVRRRDGRRRREAEGFWLLRAGRAIAPPRRHDGVAHRAGDVLAARAAYRQKYDVSRRR